MDFMCFLPPEILEKILSYVDNDDLKNCIQVSDIWRRNINDLCNWKTLCIKNDWFLENSINQASRSTWKQCFWLNFNWYFGFYDIFRIPICRLTKIHLATDLVIRVFQNRLEIWSFNVIPRLEQTITFSHTYRSTVIVFKNFLVNQQNTSLQIYHRLVPAKQYRLYRDINLPDGTLGGIDYRKLNNKTNTQENIVLIKLNEYFVAVTFKGNQNIFVWNLENDREWIVAPNIDHIFQMEIELNVLFIVTLDMTMSCYKVRGFNLDEQVWTLEVILYDNTPFGINPPVIWVNAWFIMSIAEIYQFQNRYLYSPLKVWNREGRFVALEFPNCSRQPYFQCCLKENIVIFTINDNTIAVWEPLGETITRSFTVERGYDDLQMVPGNAVAISYSHMLQFWDWKLGVQLQCINFDTRAIVRPVVNDQYYVHENMEEIVFYKFQNSCKNILL